MKDDLLFLIHMIEHGRKVCARVNGLTRQAFDANEDLQLALTQLIQIIGEAAREITPATQALLTDIPWPQIVGMRHRIVHDYINIDFDVVWETATKSIPDLVAALEPFVRQRLPEKFRGKI